MHNYGADETFVICWNLTETYGALPKYLIVGRKYGHIVGPIINQIVCHIVGSIIYEIVCCMVSCIKSSNKAPQILQKFQLNLNSHPTFVTITYI